MAPAGALVYFRSSCEALADMMLKNRAMEVNGQPVGLGHLPLFVAEIGGNHGGDPQLAAEMVRAAANAGAGAVKFQAYHAPNFMSRRSPYYEELAAEELSFDDLGQLVELAHQIGIAAGLTAFDDDGVNLAVNCGVDFIKISSGDLNHHRLLEKASRTDLPMLVSTGAATQAEVDRAIDILGPAKSRLILLQCTSLYPAPPQCVDLAVMHMWLKSGLAAGFSDHTMDITAARMAIVLGAVVVEKHFTTDRSLPGGDNSISALPDEFHQLVEWSVLKQVIMGEDVKRVFPEEAFIRPVIRRAVVAKRDLPQGWKLTENDLTLLRPPTAEGALGPDYLSRVMGRALVREVPEGEIIAIADLEDG